jgi:hypothetical protein
VALTLLALGIGGGGFATAAETASLNHGRDGGFLMATAGETIESVRATEPRRLVAGRAVRARGASEERRGRTGPGSTSPVDKVLLLRAVHFGYMCPIERPCSATKLYVPDTIRKNALSIVSSRNRATGGRYDDGNAIR